MAHDSMEGLIEDINRRWDEAFNQGDAAGVAALYASDARLLTPTRVIAFGPGEIQAYWQSVIEHGIAEHRWETVECGGVGSTAWLAGRWAAVGPARDGGRQAHAGNLMVLYIAAEDGWRIRLHIWN